MIEIQVRTKDLTFVHDSPQLHGKVVHHKLTGSYHWLSAAQTERASDSLLPGFVKIRVQVDE